MSSTLPPQLEPGSNLVGPAEHSLSAAALARSRAGIQPTLPEAYRTIPVAPGSSWLRKAFAFAGPGYLVAVGYMDPGNWATDLGGGSKFGYTLLSVVLLSSLMAMLLQALSAKLGIAMGRDLAQACRESVRGLLPRAEILRDREMLYIAIGILGATVMPHNLYLHSSIVQTRAFGSSSADKREALRFAVFDSTLALAFAFFVNAAILVLAAAAFHSRGITYVAEI